jgi:hypothetical protein
LLHKNVADTCATRVDTGQQLTSGISNRVVLPLLLCILCSRNDWIAFNPAFPPVCAPLPINTTSIKLSTGFNRDCDKFTIKVRAYGTSTRSEARALPTLIYPHRDVPFILLSEGIAVTQTAFLDIYMLSFFSSLRKQKFPFTFGQKY